MKDKKTQPLGTTLKNDFILLLVLNIIVLILTFNKAEMSSNIVRIADTLLIVFGFITASKGAKVAGIIGIIVGILLVATILMYDLIDCLLGIVMLVHSIKYLKNFKKQSQ